MKNICLLFLLIFASCAGTSNKQVEQKNPFDPLTLKKNLVIGKTDQSEILKTFGSPSQIAQDAKRGDETWVYSMHSRQAQRDGAGVGLSVYNWTKDFSGLILPSIDVDHHETTSQNSSVNLVLEFNKKKLLANYQLRKVAY